MNPSQRLEKVLRAGCTIRVVEDDIYSVLPDVPYEHLYDKRAAAYDSIVGTLVYNRLMWGTSPADYVAFAREAVDTGYGAPMLDAGCGSMLFTAQLYVATSRQIIAFDQSLRMLQRARARLIQLAGSVPTHIILLQADLNDIVFRPGEFQSILCLNVLHQFADAAELIPRLKDLLANTGQLFVTSLVSNGRFIGDLWLGLLYRSGEFVRPRSADELNNLIKDSFGEEVAFRTRGNMAFAGAAKLPSDGDDIE